METFSHFFDEEIKRLGGYPLVAKQLGVARNTLVNWGTNGNTPLDKLVEMQALGLDIGRMFELKGAQKIETSFPISSELSDFATVPRYAVTASAGFGQVNGSEEIIERLCFSRKWLAKRGLSPNNLALIAIAGKSMEPVLWDTDLVLIDLANRQPRSGRAYALRQGDELLVKFCQLMPGGLLRVSSANPDFPPYDIDLSKSASEVEVLGSVESSMHEW